MHGVGHVTERAPARVSHQPRAEPRKRPTSAARDGYARQASASAMAITGKPISTGRVKHTVQYKPTCPGGTTVALPCHVTNVTAIDTQRAEHEAAGAPRGSVAARHRFAQRRGDEEQSEQTLRRGESPQTKQAEDRRIAAQAVDQRLRREEQDARRQQHHRAAERRRKRTHG